MATINGLTAERMQEIIDKTVVDADIVAGHLILTLDDGSTVDAGNVGGVPKGNAFPAGATDGDLFVRTDQALDPLYKYTDGSWVIAGGAGVTKATAFPTVPAPTDGDLVVRTDQVGDPLYKYTDGIWELQPRMGALTPPMTKATRLTGGAQTVGNGSSAAVAFPTEEYDTDTMHDTASNTTRVTAKTPGLYRITGFIAVDAGGTGYLSIQGPNTPADPMPTLAMNGADRGVVTTEVRMAAGDYVELMYQNNTGATRTIARASLSAAWVGGAGQTVDERGVPACCVSHSVNQTLNGQLAFDTEEFDTDGMHDTAVNNSRITIKTPGLYTFTANLYCGVTRPQVGFLINGATFIAGSSSSGNPGDVNLTFTRMMVAGDYVQVTTQSGAQQFDALASRAPRFSAIMVGSGKTVTPFVKAKFSGSVQPVPNIVTTLLAWPSETADNDSIHDTVTNNSRLTCKTAGVYDVALQIYWPATNGGTREIWIDRYNAAGVFQEQVAGNDAMFNANSSYSSCSGHVEMAVGDYLTCKAWHDQGGTLNLAVDGRQSFSMVKVGAPNVGPLSNLPQTYESNIERSAAGHAQVETTWPIGSVAANDTQIFGFYRTSTGAQNAELAWDELLDSGTYTFRLLHAKGNDHGIYTVSIDGTVIGTIDGYDASISLLNQFGEILNVPVSAGKRRISIKMATKNGASSNYYGQITQWSMTKN